MDPAAIVELLKLGTTAGLLLIAVLWFARRDQRNERHARERESECKKRNDDLGKRIEYLEDHLVGQYADLAERGFTGLAAATAAIRRTLGDTVTPPDPLPTLHVHHPSDHHLTPRTST